MTAPGRTNRAMSADDNLYIVRGMNSEPVILCYLDLPFNLSRNYAAPLGCGTGGAAFNYT